MKAKTILDAEKKHLFQGHELDTAHMAKELGDVAWYLAVSANAIGYDLENHHADEYGQTESQVSGWFRR